MTASAENRSSAVTCPTRLRTTRVPGTICAPSATASAMRSVLPDEEWYVTKTLSEPTTSCADTCTEDARRPETTTMTDRHVPRRVDRPVENGDEIAVREECENLLGLTDEMFLPPYVPRPTPPSKFLGRYIGGNESAILQSTSPEHRTGGILDIQTRLFCITLVAFPA